jgi:hypothetical protein
MGIPTFTGMDRVAQWPTRGVSVTVSDHDIAIRRARTDRGGGGGSDLLEIVRSKARLSRLTF